MENEKLVFTTDVLVKYNNRTMLSLPDMTKKFMIPYKVEIYELSGPKDNKTLTKAKDIICRFMTRHELFKLCEPYFTNNHVVDMEKYIGDIENYGRLNVELSNKGDGVREFRFISHYRFSQGGIIFQERNVVFDKFMEEISKAGRCSKISLSFNRPIKKIFCLTTSCCVEGDWIESFSVENDSENPSDEDDEMVYEFDFLDSLSDYIDYLNFLKLKVEYDTEDKEILNAYITAYGFPNAM
jgi:hypothetical protein